ncbi:MAG TPA: alpha/beta hydrolase [Acidimicrobiia bacterium]
MRHAWRLGLCLLFACSGGGQPVTTTITVATTPASTIVTDESEYLRSVDSVTELPVTVYGPETVGPYPIVVLFHGGGWFGGSPISTAPLAEYLAAQEVVVFNSTYRTQTGGFPESFDDVACAIRYARANAQAFTSADGPLVIAGHSAGAHLASVVALAGDEFGDTCPVVGSATVDRFIGLAGPYDPTLYQQVLPAFYGTRFENDPKPWEAGSAYSYLGDNSGIEILLMHGEADELVPISSSRLFADALGEAGYSVELAEIKGAPHQALRDPNVVGATLVDFLNQ